MNLVFPIILITLKGKLSLPSSFNRFRSKNGNWINTLLDGIWRAVRGGWRQWIGIRGCHGFPSLLESISKTLNFEQEYHAVNEEHLMKIEEIKAETRKVQENWPLTTSSKVVRNQLQRLRGEKHTRIP